MKIRYFFIQDKIVAEGFTVEYSPISGMLADYYTKPVQCTTFGKYFNLKVRIRKSAGAKKDSSNDISSKIPKACWKTSKCAKR